MPNTRISKRSTSRCLLVGLVFSVGCRHEQVQPTTQLLVTVNGDDDVAAQLTRVDVDVRDADGIGASPTQTFRISETWEPASGEVFLPFSFGVVKGNASRVRLTAVGFGAGAAGREQPIIEWKVISAFKPGEVLPVRVFFADDCLGPEHKCADDSTCYGVDTGATHAGECGPIVDPDLTVNDAGPGDAMADAAGSGGDPIDTGQAPLAGQSGQAGQAPASGQSGQAPLAGAGGIGSAGASGGGAGGDAGGAAPTGVAGQAGASGGAANGCDACVQGESCIAGSCMCMSQRTTYYRDSDGDGHGDSKQAMTVCGSATPGYVASGDDCCDTDSRAHPGATTAYTTATSCPSSGGTPSFDFDCNGKETLERDRDRLEGGTCCLDPEDGWRDEIPECGEIGEYTSCDWETCAPDTRTATQACR